MAVAAVNASTAPSQSAYGLSFQSLLKIILTQLTYQDPLKPLDNFQFVSQLAEFSQLQQSQTLNTQVTSLLAAQSASQATTFLGRTVDYATSQTTGSGTVKSVAFSDGQPLLTVLGVDGSTTANITLSQISQVR